MTTINGQNREPDYAARRQRMVERQLAGRGIRDERVLDAMRLVPRHRFIDARFAELAYDDRPLPIGGGQTISQPYIVAYMIETAAIEAGDRVLEVGTGTGYQAAVLGQLAAEVYTIEIVPELGRKAQRNLRELTYDNVHVRIGDGYAGWPEYAPFDAIIVAAAAAEVPPPLVEQLAEGGRLIIPVGEADSMQFLELLRKVRGKIRRERLVPVRFVPFTREEE